MKAEYWRLLGTALGWSAVGSMIVSLATMVFVTNTFGFIPISEFNNEGLKVYLYTMTVCMYEFALSLIPLLIGLFSWGYYIRKTSLPSLPPPPPP